MLGLSDLEVGEVTIGFAMLMIAANFIYRSVSVFAIMPMSIALMLNAGVAIVPPVCRRY